MCPANICTSPVRLMYTAGKISTCPDWKITCPVRQEATKFYVPWDKIYMPRACRHALMSSPVQQGIYQSFHPSTDCCVSMLYVNSSPPGQNGCHSGRWHFQMATSHYLHQMSNANPITDASIYTLNILQSYITRYYTIPKEESYNFVQTINSQKTLHISLVMSSLKKREWYWVHCVAEKYIEI